MAQEEPASKLDVMFSRGIDPDVSDPSKCHNHPDAPQEWPTKDQIVRYAQQVLPPLTFLPPCRLPCTPSIQSRD